MNDKLIEAVGKKIVHIEQYYRFCRIWFEDGSIVNISTDGGYNGDALGVNWLRQATYSEIID